MTVVLTKATSKMPLSLVRKSQLSMDAKKRFGGYFLGTETMKSLFT